MSFEIKPWQIKPGEEFIIEFNNSVIKKYILDFLEKKKYKISANYYIILNTKCKNIIICDSIFFNMKFFSNTYHRDNTCLNNKIL